MHITLGGLLTVLFTVAGCGLFPSSPNVVFIAIDDLRPQTGAYGYPYMVTPHLDALAAQGRLFERHYVQVPTCGASRRALLTGLRPTAPAHLTNDALRNSLPPVERERPETIAHLFRRAGYRTIALGKVGHYPDGRVFAYDGSGEGALEMPFSWDEQWAPSAPWGSAWNGFFGYADGTNRNDRSSPSPAYERAEVPDTAYPDGLIAEEAVRRLATLAAEGDPFFLAVGFHKPHLPFNAPKAYWDLYDPAQLPLPPNAEPPAHVHATSLNQSGELFNNYTHPVRLRSGRPIPEAYARTLRHGYFAAVSYVDAQVGKVLRALDALNLTDDTIVVVWGDHGWHLGDQGLWGKHTTYEPALRSALIIRTPGLSQPGDPTHALVESVDLYPTLAELGGLDPPPFLAGRSLVPALQDPLHPGKDGAFSYWRGRTSLRTDQYRLTVSTDSSDVWIELFDLQETPYETRNIAQEQASLLDPLLNQWHYESPR